MCPTVQDVRAKFANWPKEKTRQDEYEEENEDVVFTQSSKHRHRLVQCPSCWSLFC